MSRLWLTTTPKNSILINRQGLETFGKYSGRATKTIHLNMGRSNGALWKTVSKRYVMSTIKTWKKSINMEHCFRFANFTSIRLKSSSMRQKTVTTIQSFTSTAWGELTWERMRETHRLRNPLCSTNTGWWIVLMVRFAMKSDLLPFSLLIWAMTYGLETLEEISIANRTGTWIALYLNIGILAFKSWAIMTSRH